MGHAVIENHQTCNGFAVVLFQDFSFRDNKEYGCGNYFSRDPTAV